MAEGDQFEIQVYMRDHWVTEEFCKSEREAQASAQAILKSNGFDGVRILKIRTRGEKESERIIFSKIKEATRVADVIRVTPIEDAPICQSPVDLFKPEARLTATRVLKQYLDKFVLTPTEILHNHREMKRLLDFESLAPSAVSRVASVQSKGEGGASEAGKRNAALYDLINICAENVRKASAITDLPTLKDGSLSRILSQLQGRIPADQQEYVATVILCRELVNIRSWLGKLETVLGLINQETEPRAKKLATAVISDVFGSSEALRDMLGRQPDLAAALMRALDIAEGRVEADGKLADVAVGLSETLADPLLQEPKYALYMAIARQLKGMSPLSTRDQLEAFRKLAERLVGPAGVTGGPAMAEAIVFGYQRFVEEGGETGRRNAVKRSISALSIPAARGILLIDFLETAQGQQLRDVVLETLQATLGDVRDLGALVPTTLSAKDRMQRVVGLHLALQRGTVPEEIGLPLAEQLDEAMARFVLEGKLVERLDDPSSSLRQRATKLVQFCVTDVLTKPKAHDIFRERVVTHLRQPNFEEVFVADIADPAQRQEALRSFHALLSKAGFR